MTKQEVNNLLAFMKANYSYAFKSMSTDDKYILLNSWAFALQDMDANIVMIACLKLLSVCKWLPTVAEIRDKVKDLYYEAENMKIRDWEVVNGLYTREQQRIANRKAQYIEDHTYHLRGDNRPELSLDAIMNNPQYERLAANNGAMLGIESALPDPEFDYEEDDGA